MTFIYVHKFTPSGIQYEITTKAKGKDFQRRLFIDSFPDSKVNKQTNKLQHCTSLEMMSAIIPLLFAWLLSRAGAIYPMGALRCCNTLARPDDLSACVSKIGRGTVRFVLSLIVTKSAPIALVFMTW